MSKNRAIAAVRLSQLHKASQTGVDKQDEATEKYIDAMGWKLVDTATDTNVSGGSDPFSRPGLGPWLTDPDKIASYDIIVASKLDRLARSTKYFAQLIEWATANNKRVICLDVGGESVDFGSRVGGLIGYIISWLAEGELELITGRITETYYRLRDKGQFPGGKIFYGYHSVCVCHGLPNKSPECVNPEGFTLAIHEGHAAILREIVLRVIGEHQDHADTPNGESMAAIAEDLNRRGVPTPYKSRGWNAASIGKQLSNPAIAGYATHYPLTGEILPSGKPGKQTQPEIVTDPVTGMGFRPNPPIIDDQMWERLRDVVSKRFHARRVGPTLDAHMLTGIIECPCGIKLYYRQSYPGNRDRGKLYEYYQRGSDASRAALYAACTHSGIKVDVAETAVNDWIEANSYPFTERKLVSGGAKERSITEIKAQRARHMEDLNAGRITPEQFSGYFAKLNERLAELESGDDDMPVYEYVPTGKTLAGEWASWSVSQRNKWLTDSGIRVIARNGELAIVTQ